MKLYKKIILIIAIITAFSISLTAINILQNGTGGWDGRSIDKILGVPADKATLNDIKKLSKSEVMQLFHASGAPEFTEMKGEFRAETLPLGIMAAPADFFTHNFFGPGRWKGKAFFPFEKNRGWGYNLFVKAGEDSKTITSRTRKMNTFIAKSSYDDKASFHLDYSPHNGGMIHSMHDEIRKINDNLYIGMGYMAAGGGSINPAPFVLLGPSSKWIGPDEK